MLNPCCALDRFGVDSFPKYVQSRNAGIKGTEYKQYFIVKHTHTHTNTQPHYCFVNTPYKFGLKFIFNKVLWKDHQGRWNGISSTESYLQTIFEKVKLFRPCTKQSIENF